jgi:hypothetical protein
MIHIFNSDLERIGILTTFISLEWGEYYNDTGIIRLTLNNTPENVTLFMVGNIIYQQSKQTAMRISHVAFDTAKQTITVNGFTTLDYLSQRAVIEPVEISNAEQGMYQIVHDNLRGLPIELAKLKEYDAEFETEVVGEVLNELKRIAAEANLGYKMLFDHRAAKHTFEVYIGTDRTWGQHDTPPVVFSEELKNLYNLRVVTDDSLFYNVVYVVAEDRNDNRRIVTVGDIDGNGVERHELYLKANFAPERGESINSPAYIERMETFGQDELNKRLNIQTFIAEVDPKEWQVKYNLGDLVTCKSKRYGLRFDARIMHFKEVTENNRTRVTLTLGEPEYSIINEFQLGHM